MPDVIKERNVWLVQAVIVLCAALLFIPGLGMAHLFDWDELNFAESAREMIVSGNYLTVQVNFEPFWEKPPLFIWMQVLSMKIFGINEFAARLPNAICGIVTLLVLFNIGRKLKNVHFGLLWTGLYVSSVLPFFYFRSGIIDPWFNLFIFLGLYFSCLLTAPEHQGNTILQSFLSAFFIGLAILAKGPVALLIFLLVAAVYLVSKKFRVTWCWKEILTFSAVLVIVGGFWFILQLLIGNYRILQDFVVYQIRLFQTKDAGHGGFLLYHFVVLLIGVFPASILALPTFSRSVLKAEDNRRLAHLFFWMMTSFLVVLLLFTVVKTKIVHYSSFCYFPLSFLAAWYMEKVFEKRLVVHRFQNVMLTVTALLFGVLLVVLALFDRLKTSLLPFITDEFVRGNLQATAEWSGFEPLAGIVLVILTLVFCFRIRRYPTMNTALLLMGGALLFVAVSICLVVPQIEKYSQAAAVEFYQSRKGQDCYIYPTVKSYAHYFYSARLPQNRAADEKFLMAGNLDKPCYFVLKNYHDDVVEFTRKVPDARMLYEKNGFAFFIRPAGK